MNSTNINVEAFSFVERLKTLDGEFRQPAPINKNLKGDGVKPIAHFEEVSNLRVDKFNPIDGKVVSKYKDLNGQMVGLDEETFIGFSELLTRVSQLDQFEGKCDFDFLIDSSFEWLIEVYFNKVASKDLIPYLLDKIGEETKEYIFYYKIEGLSIENEFDIGNSKIVYISEQKIEELIAVSEQKLSNLDYYKNLKGINLRVAITSTYGNSKNLALRDGALSVDVLKCFLARYSLEKFHTIPDLTFRRSNVKNHTYYIFTNESNNGEVQFQNIGGFIPLPLDNKFLENANRYGFEYFSNFIKHRHHDDLYLEIIAMIQRLAQIVSTFNNHEKIAKIISLLEGAILSRSIGGRGFGERKIKTSVLPKLTTSYLDVFQKVAGKAYRIRDAFVHNCQELPMEEKTILVMFEITRMFIIEIIKLHQSGKKQFEDIERYFLE